MSERYTVWVGGTEVTWYLMSLADAQIVAERWRRWGYDDVQIERVTE